MTIRFMLLVNKQGQTRLASYNEAVPMDERRQIEGEIVRKCLSKNPNDRYPTMADLMNDMASCMNIPPEQFRSVSQSHSTIQKQLAIPSNGGSKPLVQMYGAGDSSRGYSAAADSTMASASSGRIGSGVISVTSETFSRAVKLGIRL